MFKLCEHPHKKIYSIAIRYLEEHVSWDLEKLKNLQYFFIKVLSQVCQARESKNLIIRFFQKEIDNGKSFSKFILNILKRQSVTISIIDKSCYLELLTQIHSKYPEIENIIKVIEPKYVV